MNRKIYVLYNPKAGNGDCCAKARALEKAQLSGEAVYLDITELHDYAAFARELSPEDQILICGGDGTLNCFINDTYDLHLSNDILYYGIGTGNDFLRDLGKEAGCPPFRINDYLKNLPL